jgi:aspartate 1-decarboxylase
LDPAGLGLTGEASPSPSVTEADGAMLQGDEPMMLTMLKCKLHRATVTECDLHYEGSISIDAKLIEAAGLLLNERVEIYNIDNGERFATYVIEGKRGSGVIGLNGAAARKACVGDKVIICAYAAMTHEEAKKHEPKVVLCGHKNKAEMKK